jgi:hypothetical protein
MKGQKGIRILAPMIGIRKKKDSEAEKDITKQNQPVLVGFRSGYVFEKLSRDLWPRLYALDVTRGALRTPLDNRSHIIAQFCCPLQRLLAISLGVARRWEQHALLSRAVSGGGDRPLISPIAAPAFSSPAPIPA